MSCAADVLGMNNVCGLRGVGGVCEMCMCMDRGGVEDEWIRGKGLGYMNPVRTGGMLLVCLCLCCGGVGGVCGEWLELGTWSRGV